MIMKILSIFGILLISLGIHAQITTSPNTPQISEDIEIVFDAGKGNKALFGHDGEVYFHAGLITSNSATDKDWKFVQGNWGKADEHFQMENLGGDKYKVIINPQDFFQFGADIEVQQMAIVFRDAKGEKVAKTKNETDFLIPLNGFKPLVKYQDNLKYKKRLFKSYTWNNNELILYTSHGNIQYRFLDNNIIKATFYPEQEKAMDIEVSVIEKHKDECTLSFSDEVIVWKKNGMYLKIHTEPLVVSYFYKDSLLLKEELGFFEKQESSGIRFNLSPNEAIYGTGERAVPLNRRGYKLDLYNRPDYNYGKNARNLNYTLPVVLSSKKYLLFIDNYQKGYIDIGETEGNIMEFGSIGEKQQYYVVAGDSYNDISNSFTKLVGRQPLPPRWALGNLQSRMAYRTQDELEGIVDEMIKNDFPLDAVIIDFYWFGDSIKGYLGNLKWYHKNWPQPEKMIANFKEKGVKTILITEPFVIDTSYWFEHGDTSQLFATHENGETYIMNDFYFGKAALMDIFKQQTKDWFWEQYQKQIEIGVAGWWGDLGEPETHPADMFHINGKAEEVHNIYAHEWAAMLYNKYQEHYPKTRLFHLNRSGATGTQRYSIFPWSGDVSRSWSGFQAQLPLMLNMSLCGLAYSSSDLGGFALGEKDEELYLRWLQMGAFTPIFRPHGSGIPSEPIFFSKETQDVIREAIKLRYRLMPYIYNAAYENTNSGKPIVKPLFYYHPNDKELMDYSDTYYFGDDIIVAPIIHKGVKSKEIYLPNGFWVDFYSDQIFQGGESIEMEITQDHIPVFVKAGAFIPMLGNYQSTDQYPDDKLYIHYYPSYDTITTNFSLYEDDGTNAQNIEKENYQMIYFSGKNTSEEINITLRRDKKSYSEDQGGRRIIWEVHNLDKFPGTVEIDGKRIEVYNSLRKPRIKNIDAKYVELKKTLIIKIPFQKDQMNIKIIKAYQ